MIGILFVCMFLLFIGANLYLIYELDKEQEEEYNKYTKFLENCYKHQRK